MTVNVLNGAGTDTDATLTLASFGARPVVGFDNRPAFAAAIADLVALSGLSRSQSTAAATVTGSITNGSAVVACTATTSYFFGMYVTGPGIPPLTTILATTYGVGFTMSAPATADGAGVALGVGYPRGTIVVGDGFYEIHSPCPNFGPYVSVKCGGKAQTKFVFKGAGSCFTFEGSALGTLNLSTVVIDGCLIDGASAAASGRIDTTCTTEEGSTTVLDANCTADDAGEPVYGMGITHDVTITAVTPGVSFELSYPAPYDRTSRLQIGGVRNAGLTVTGIEGGGIGDDVGINNFSRPGSAGLFVLGRVYPLKWNEKIRIPKMTFYGNSIHVLAYLSSLSYNDWCFEFFFSGNTEEGLAIDSAGLRFAKVIITGNCYVNVGQHSNLFAVRGNHDSTLAGYPTAGGGAYNGPSPAHVQDSEIDINVELSGSGDFTRGIFIGPDTIGGAGVTGNVMTGCYGRVKLGYGAGTQFLASNVAPKKGKFEFHGLVFGDASLSSTPSLPLMTHAGGTVQQLAQATVDFSSADHFDLTLTANRTIAFTSNLAGPARKVFRIAQAAAGGPWTVTWPNAGSPTVVAPKVIWLGGTPTQSTGASVADLYILTTVDGATWYGQHIPGA